MPMKDNLPQLVRTYKQTCRPRHQSHLDFYRSLETLEEAIKRAAQATGEDSKINAHQRRVGRVILGKASTKLLRKAGEIESCTGFHDLIELIERVTAKIDRFGELAVYDTSLRIGSWLDLLPERVYIHAGTRKGAKALGLSATDGYVEVDERQKGDIVEWR